MTRNPKLSLNIVEDDVMIVDDFLSPEECRFILEDLEFALWRPSMTYILQQDAFSATSCSKKLPK